MFVGGELRAKLLFVLPSNFRGKKAWFFNEGGFAVEEVKEVIAC
jgi:hypothetical protein